MGSIDMKSSPFPGWKEESAPTSDHQVCRVLHCDRSLPGRFGHAGRHNPELGIMHLWGIHLTGVRNLPPRAARRRSLQAGRMSALSRRLGRNSLWALAYDKVVCISREPSLKLPKRLRVVGAGMGTFHCPNLRPTPVKWIPRSCLMGKFTNGELAAT